MLENSLDSTYILNKMYNNFETELFLQKFFENYPFGLPDTTKYGEIEIRFVCKNIT